MIVAGDRGVLGYVLAGVIGKVFAETIIDAIWPAAGVAPRRDHAADVRLPAGRAAGRVALARPASRRPGRRASRSRSPCRRRGRPEDDEPDLPEAVRDLLQHAVELTRTRRLGDHDPAADDRLPALDGLGREAAARPSARRA